MANTITTTTTMNDDKDDSIFEGKIQSKLSPIVGTAAAKQAALQDVNPIKAQLVSYRS